jgi:D-amino-acid oxidase
VHNPATRRDILSAAGAALPQPDINYGLFYKDVAFVPRRGGLVFQVLGDSDYYGFNDDTTIPDRAEAEHAVDTIAGLYT